MKCFGINKVFIWYYLKFRKYGRKWERRFKEEVKWGNMLLLEFSISYIFDFRVIKSMGIRFVNIMLREVERFLNF